MSNDVFRAFLSSSESDTIFDNLPSTLKEVFADLNKAPSKNLEVAISQIKKHHMDNSLASISVMTNLMIGWGGIDIVDLVSGPDNASKSKDLRLFEFWDEVHTKLVKLIQSEGKNITHIGEKDIQDYIQRVYENDRVAQLVAELDENSPLHRGYIEYANDIRTNAHLSTLGEITRLMDIYSAQSDGERKGSLDLLVIAIQQVNTEESDYFNPVIDWVTARSLEALVMDKYFAEFPIADLTGSSIRWVYNVIRKMNASFDDGEDRGQRILEMFDEMLAEDINKRAIIILIQQYEELLTEVSESTVVSGIKDLDSRLEDMNLPLGYTLLDDPNRQAFFGDSELLKGIRDSIIMREIDALIKKGLPLTKEEKVFMTKAYYTKLLDSGKREELLISFRNNVDRSDEIEKPNQKYVDAFHDEATYRQILKERFGGSGGRQSLRAEG